VLYRLDGKQSSTTFHDLGSATKLAPGSVDTDMVRANPQEFIDAMAASSLLKRIATPRRVEAPALLRVSDAGSFITGQTLIANGEMVAR